LRGRGRQRQRRGSEIERYLGREHRHHHLDDEGDGDRAGQEAGDQQRATDDLQDRNEIGGEIRRRKPELGEASHALVGVHEFEDAFRQEDASRHAADQDRRSRSVERRLQHPIDELLERHAFLLGRWWAQRRRERRL